MNEMKINWALTALGLAIVGVLATTLILHFHSDDNDGPFYTASNGNVALGNKAPTQKLDVTGSIKASDKLYVGAQSATETNMLQVSTMDQPVSKTSSPTFNSVTIGTNTVSHITEELHTSTLTGGRVDATGAVYAQLTRVNNLVTIKFKILPAAGVAAVMTFGTAIPAKYRPSSTKTVKLEVLDNALSAVGEVTVDSAGIIKIGVGTVAGAFTVTALCAVTDSISYTV